MRRLTDVEGVLGELRSIYRLTRMGRLPSGELTRLAYTLSQMARLIETSQIENRLQQAERTIAELLGRLEAKKR